VTVLDRIAARRAKAERKSFSEPPFWAHDQSRLPFLTSSTLMADREEIDNDFVGYIRGAFKSNGVIFALILARQLVFSEARFQWRRFENGRPQDLFGSDELRLLERPWPGGTTGELLAHMEQDASLAGNFFATTADNFGRLGRRAQGPTKRVVRMRPDWVTILITSRSEDPWALDARIAGYLYEPMPATPGTPTPPGENAVLLTPAEVCHYSPIPDPEARFRGMSWLTPVVREIQADTQSTIHKDAFLRNGATPNIVVKFDKDTAADSFDEFVEGFNASHKGAANAYKTLFLMGGADVSTIGTDFRQLDFSATVGKGESRLASAAGVPPSWVGFSEGLSGSSLNAGNFAAARRRFADGTMRPLWRMAAASLEPLLIPPSGAELWYDDRDIAFLREDQGDQASIQNQQVMSIVSATREGMTHESAIAAITSGDLTLLKPQLDADGQPLRSVQLQPPLPTTLEPTDTSEED
jgi:phage portal protein BeeE